MSTCYRLVCFALLGGLLATPSWSQVAPLPLFDVDDALSLTLTADFNRLFKDREDDNPYREATLSYQDQDGNEVALDIKVKTRRSALDWRWPATKRSAPCRILKRSTSWPRTSPTI